MTKKLAALKPFDLLFGSLKSIRKMEHGDRELADGEGVALNLGDADHHAGITCYRVDCTVCVSANRAHIYAPGIYSKPTDLAGSTHSTAGVTKR